MLWQFYEQKNQSSNLTKRRALGKSRSFQVLEVNKKTSLATGFLRINFNYFFNSKRFKNGLEQLSGKKLGDFGLFAKYWHFNSNLHSQFHAMQTAHPFNQI